MNRSRCSRVGVLVVVMLGVTMLSAAAAQGTDAARGNNDPTNGSKDVDRVIQHAPDLVLPAAKQALITYGCNVKNERSNFLECTRSRHVGVFVGSGGEKITVQLFPQEGGTRVVIKTGKGFVGRVGKKNWSTPVFKEIEHILGQS